MEPLKKCQVEGHLMYAEPEDLFGNLDELCYVSKLFTYKEKDMRNQSFLSYIMHFVLYIYINFFLIAGELHFL